MLSIYSVRIFRNLVSQRSLRSFPKSVIIRTANLRWFSETISSRDIRNLKSRRTKQEENIRKFIKLISGYPNPESIKWEELEKQLNIEMQESRLAIIQACLRLKDLDTGMSYFNHVSKNGEDFTPVELVFFLKLFNQKDKIIKYESLVKQMYDKVKLYMDSEVIQNYLLKMISEIPDCFSKLTKSISDDKKSQSGSQLLAAKALNLKNAKEAFEMMSTCNININYVFKDYVDYLCHMVMENKFSVDMITDLLKHCEEHNNIISSANFQLFSTKFFNTLKQYDNNYNWTLSQCGISESSICSNCGKKLVDKCISESDFNTLKETFFLKAGLTETNVFLSSSDQELTNYFEFLKSCKPYQMVVDGLNLMYKSKRSSSHLSRPLKYFLDKDMDVLVIGKKHVKNEFLRMSFLKKKPYKDRCQFFFTDNLSDDDLFTLYGALHGGLGTYFISGDFLQRYGARFDNSLKRIYFRWKSYHQFVYKTNIVPPLPSLGLSQLTSDENGKQLTWHISHVRDNFLNNLLTPSFSLKWACLQAKKKSP